MTYYGNTIAVTVDELTGGDCPVITFANYQNLRQRGRINVLRPGKGYGSCALIEYASLPERFKSRFVAKYGEPEKVLSRDRDALRTDAAARAYYEDYELADGSRLKSDKIEEYTLNASVLGRLLELVNLQRSRRNMSGNRTPLCWEAVYDSCEEMRRCYGHTLPGSAARLRDKLRQYRAEGYGCLVSGKLTNANAVKITEEAGRQIIALKRCKTPVYTNSQIFAKFNEIASERGWKPLRSESALTAYLNRPEVEIRWKGAAMGDKESKRLYVRQNSTILPTRRDTLWYGDGTKLNLYYKVFSGGEWKPASLQVFEVVDAASEVLLGYNISTAENFESMYEAYRSAIEFSGHLPEELVYDNQGGTKREDAAVWLKKISGLSRPTQPYNAQSKTIENIFGRFQSQVLHQCWHYTGGNITSRADRSKADVDFVMANIASLPTYNELIELYPKLREQWNAMPHPKHAGVSRMQYYLSAEAANDRSTQVNAAVLRDLFWVMTPKPCTFTAYGLLVTVKGQRYQYEVLDAEGMPDLEWRAKNTRRQFYVSYDPHDMGTVRLYTGDGKSGYRFIAEAKPYIQIHRALSDQTEQERSFIRRMEEAVRQDRVRRELDGIALDLEFGVAPEQHGLRRAKLKGISDKTFERIADSQTAAARAVPDDCAEAGKTGPEEPGPQVYPTSVGRMDKAVSNMTYDEAAALDRL